jgi:uroporphyrin-III C-methyltransferase
MNPSATHSTAPGKVVFIGAGPGDPELLTIKALRWLQRADVIITDRLVSPEILTGYASPAAQIIPVGKQGRSDTSTPQPAINALLVSHAAAGRLVIRLKGGDISIFSNILDELQTLTENGIRYELVPGVTAALGAAAYAGIPLTARGYSTAVRFLTAYREDLLDLQYWNDLAQTEDTLVFYMSADPIDHLVTRLLDHGIPHDRWVTVIEQATTPKQKITSHPIRQYLAAAADRAWQSPTLIIIGKVGELQERFAWLPEPAPGSAYFPAAAIHPSVAHHPSVANYPSDPTTTSALIQKTSLC